MITDNATEKLFKQIYGTLISVDYLGLTEEEITQIALMTVRQFAKQHGVKIPDNY